MFPFGTLFSGAILDLKVPGESVQQEFESDVNETTAYSGLRFNATTGNIDWKSGFNGTYSALGDNDMWVHSSAKTPVAFDASLYECRYIYQSGDGVSEVRGNANNTWVDCDTNPEWYVRILLTAFQTVEIQGLIQIREKANTSNIKSGDVVFRAITGSP